MHPILAALAAAVAAAILLSIGQLLWHGYVTPLAKIPGPWYAALTNLPLKLAVLSGQRMQYVEAMHKRYNSEVVRLAPNEVSINNPEAFVTIHQGRNSFVKAQWYVDLGGDEVVGVFAMRNKKLVADRRRLLAMGFTKQMVKTHWEKETEELVTMAMQKMEAEGQTSANHDIDVYKWFSYMAADVGSRVMFGESSGMLEAGKKSEYSEMLESTMMMAFLLYEIPFIEYISLLLPLKIFRNVSTVREKLLVAGHQAISNAKKNTSSATANIFSHLIHGQEKDLPNLTDQDIAIEARNLLIASSDTTANVLTYFAWRVAQLPELQAELVKLVENVPEEDLRGEVLEKIPLLNATLLETLRLHGGAPSCLPRTTDHDVPLAGYLIPAGTTVDTTAYVIHRDETLWGADARVFRPERWLDDSGALRPETNEARFCPFGAGNRICLGMNLAWAELRLGSARFLRAFPTARVSPHMAAKEMDMLDFFTIKPAGGRCLLVAS